MNHLTASNNIPRPHLSKSGFPLMATCWRSEGDIDDKTWANDNFKTNYRLIDGDQVRLLSETHGSACDGYVFVPRGAVGVVVHARTPRVVGPGSYFANVDMRFSGRDERVRIRVPHNALDRVVGEESL